MAHKKHGRRAKIISILVLSVFALTSLTYAQGNVYAPAVASTQQSGNRDAVPQKVIYPSEVKSILIKETEEKLFIDRSKAVVVRFPEPFMRAAIGDPNIADIVLISEQEIIITAKAHGNTNLIVWYDTGVYNNYDVIVGMDFSKLQSVINNVIEEKGEVSVFDANNAVVLKGHVTNAATYEKVQKIAESYIATLPGSSIVNLINVDQTEQILLEVRFLEISHSLAEKHGVDVSFLTSNVAGYSWMGQTGASPDEDNQGSLKNGRWSQDLLGFDSSTGQHNIGYASGGFVGTAAIDDLEGKGILKIIANPDLITKNKEEASFLAGGEFPVVSITDSAIEVEYKDYGIQLDFLPEITERDTIKMKVKPVVSLLDFTKAAVTVNGALIPALTTRRTETTVEMESGKTLVISGLHSKGESTTKNASPLFANVPVLGKLFSTTNFIGDELELMVVVTPHIVTPMDMGQSKRLFDPDQVQRVINMSHMDIPEEQGNAMKRLLSQSDILYEQAAINLMEEAVEEKYDDDLEVEEVKRAEKEMVDYLKETNVEDAAKERKEKREVRIQKANDLRAQRLRDREIEREKRYEEKKRNEDAEKKLKEDREKAEKDKKEEKRRAKQEKERNKRLKEEEEKRIKKQSKKERQRAEELEKKKERLAKEAKEKDAKRRENAKKIERARQEEREQRESIMKQAEQDNDEMLTQVKKIDNRDKQAKVETIDPLSSIDNQIEAKRQHALALYKEGNFKEGKAELDSMFTLKQERERIAAAK